MPRKNPLADAVEAALLKSGGPFAMLTNPDGSVVSSSRAALGSLPGVNTTTEQRTSRRGTRNVSTSRAGAPPPAPRPAPAPLPPPPPAVTKARPGVPGAKAGPAWTANDQNEYRKAQEAVRALPPAAAPKPRVVASPYGSLVKWKESVKAVVGDAMPTRADDGWASQESLFAVA